MTVNEAKQQKERKKKAMQSISYSNGMRRRIVTYENINVTEFEAKNNQK